MKIWVKFLKDHDAYNTEFKKGDIRSVSKKVRDELKAEKVVVDCKEPKQKSTEEE